jgi:hypothetical protein
VSRLRWWRIGVLLERAGDPWTWTFHVRALSERKARALVAARVDSVHDLFICHPSEPLNIQGRSDEEIVADYGPYRRSKDDPMLAELLEKLA